MYWQTSMRANQASGPHIMGLGFGASARVCPPALLVTLTCGKAPEKGEAGTQIDCWGESRRKSAVFQDPDE